MKVRTKAIVVSAISGLAMIGVGCGSSPSGTYTVNETMSGGNLPANCAASQVSLSVNDSGSSMTASGSNTCFTSESVMGTDSGNGNITGVTLTLTINPTAGQSACTPGFSCNTGLLGASSSFTCTYTGNLSLANNSLTGSLTSQTTTTTSILTGNCPQTITLNGSKST